MGITNKYPNIYAECARESITKKELSTRLGITRRTIQNWQSGKSEIPAWAIVKMTKMWNVSADYLLGLSRNP